MTISKIILIGDFFYWGKAVIFFMLTAKIMADSQRRLANYVIILKNDHKCLTKILKNVPCLWSAKSDVRVLFGWWRGVFGVIARGSPESEPPYILKKNLTRWLFYVEIIHLMRRRDWVRGKNGGR